MKKFLVIGNPVEHSLSPLLHNHWIMKNNLNAIYDKEKLNEHGLENLISKIKEKKINGVNVTVPFKKKIIPFIDKLSLQAKNTQSVNTIYLENNKVIGHNTDIKGFELAIEETKFKVTNKKVLILGAGGVVPSIVFSLNKLGTSKIMISNRTKDKADKLKDLFNDLTIINWGEIPNVDMIINATSIGLNLDDKMNLDLTKFGKGKFFYDIIYNPKETDFLNTAKELGNEVENGKKMFIHQAAEAFRIWHGIKPKINEETINLLDR